jgi:hypothetical protein
MKAATTSRAATASVLAQEARMGSRVATFSFAAISAHPGSGTNGYVEAISTNSA